MMNASASASLEFLGGADLLSATRTLVRKSHGVEAELLLHLGEIDDRKLYLDCAYPSMFAFCVEELGFSEDAAYNRITVARAGRRFAAVIEAARSGRVHLAGLRLLAPHLTNANHQEVLAQATGKSKREIEELVARIAPLPPVPTVIRRLPECPVVKWSPMVSRAPGPAGPAGGDTVQAAMAGGAPAEAAADGASAERDPGGGPEAAVPACGAGDRAPAVDELQVPVAPMGREGPRTVVAPLSAETFKVQFTASRALRDKLQQAQDLMRHRVPDGDLPTIIERALDLLIDQVKKERFGVGRKARAAPDSAADGTEEIGGRSQETTCRDSAARSGSRHIPDAIKRAVYERDGGRCTFVDEHGRRCAETAALEFDHEEGFAVTGIHDIAGIRLLCRAHNQHAAEKLYGRAFMERARAAKGRSVDSSRDELNGDQVVPELVAGEALVPELVAVEAVVPELVAGEALVLERSEEVAVVPGRAEAGGPGVDERKDLRTAGAEDDCGAHLAELGGALQRPGEAELESAPDANPKKRAGVKRLFSSTRSPIRRPPSPKA